MDTRTARKRLQAGAAALWIAALACGSWLGGCRQNTGATNAVAGAQPEGPGYEPAPELQAVRALGGGRMELTGSAPPEVTVRLATPSGAASFATADAQGRWRLQIVASPEPRLFGLSMSQNSRVVQAMGYLFLAPDGWDARLRAGGGSELLGDNAQRLAAETVDYDNQRAATLAGRAGPGEAVSVRVDGVERGQASADDRGRFVIPLNQPLSEGPHDFNLTGASAEVETPVTIEAPAPLGQSPFVASRVGGGWRIDWLTPGGGEQTTLLLGHAGPAP